MKFRKLLAVILGLSISIGCVVPSFATSSRKYIKLLKPNKTYYYDIDGDKDKDKIKIKVSKKSLLLYINNKYIKLTSRYNKESQRLALYDFNKKDKTLDFLWTDYYAESPNHRILKFKNSKCVVNKKLPPDVSIDKYDSSTGKVIFLAFHGYSDVDYFYNSTGYFFDVYDKDSEMTFKPYTYMNVNKYKVNISTTFNTSNEDRKVKFKLKKGLKAYKSISDISRKNNSYEWTIGKGSKINILNLYIKDGKYYIKFRIWIDEANGKPYNKYDYGYMQVGTTRLFTI